MNKPQMSILIVDDDLDDAKWLSQVIVEMEPTAVCYFERDGIAAIRFIKNNPAPDLIFLDLNMPLKNGIECLRDMSNHNLVPDTPVVIYSTSANIRDIDLAYKHGAVYYIVKPTCEKKLKTLVCQTFTVLGRPVSDRVEKSKFVLMEGLSNTWHDPTVI